MGGKPLGGLCAPPPCAPARAVATTGSRVCPPGTKVRTARRAATHSTPRQKIPIPACQTCRAFWCRSPPPSFAKRGARGYRSSPRRVLRPPLGRLQAGGRAPSLQWTDAPSGSRFRDEHRDVVDVREDHPAAAGRLHQAPRTVLRRARSCRSGSLCVRHLVPKPIRRQDHGAAL